MPSFLTSEAAQTPPNADRAAGKQADLGEGDPDPAEQQSVRGVDPAKGANNQEAADK